MVARRAARQPHTPSGLQYLRRYCAKPFEDVAVEDEERVADERDLDSGDRQPGHGHEQLEEGKARDRVDDRGEDDERPFGQPVPMCEERSGKRDDETNRDGEEGQLHMLE